MARLPLADITSQFQPEVPECGSTNKCYCITCTNKRAVAWQCFAAWRQVVRNKKDPAPIKCSNHQWELKYGTSAPVFNVVVVHFGDALTREIIEYTNEPSAYAVSREYLSCNWRHPCWLEKTQVMTKW